MHRYATFRLSLRVLSIHTQARIIRRRKRRRLGRHIARSPSSTPQCNRGHRRAATLAKTVTLSHASTPLCLQLRTFLLARLWLQRLTSLHCISRLQIPRVSIPYVSMYFLSSFIIASSPSTGLDLCGQAISGLCRTHRCTVPSVASQVRASLIGDWFGLDHSRYHKDNRLGAVYSSLFGFWTARDAAIRASGANAQRRDSYSVVLFHHQPEIVVENDFSSTPQQLLNVLLRRDADGGTNFNGALQTSLSLMEKHWRTDQQVLPSSIA